MAEYTSDQLNEISRLGVLRELLVNTKQRINGFNRQIPKQTRNRQIFIDRYTKITADIQKITTLLETKGDA